MNMSDYPTLQLDTKWFKGTTLYIHINACVEILGLQTLYCIELLFIWYEVWVVKIFLSDLTSNTTDIGLRPQYPLHVLRFPDACPSTTNFLKAALAFLPPLREGENQKIQLRRSISKFQ